MEEKAGTTSQPMVDRDKRLIADYMALDEFDKWKYTVTDLVGKFKVGTARVYQILNKHGIKKRS